MLTNDDLDRALQSTYPTGDTDDEAWTIQCDDDAAWASRKIKSAMDELRQIEQWADRERDRINAVVARESVRSKRTIEFMSGHLRVWLATLLREGRRTKSLDLPGGRFSIRTVPARLQVNDEQRLLDWAKVHAPELVQTKETVDRQAMKGRLFTEGTTVVDSVTGEVLDFAHVEPSRESHSFRPEGDHA